MEEKEQKYSTKNDFQETLKTKRKRLKIQNIL